MIEVHKADDGKVWKHKKSGIIGSTELILGVNDSIENWEQVEINIEEQ